MEFNIDEKSPSGSEWVALRLSVGFGSYDEYQAERGLRNSLFCLSARDEKGGFVGMARIVGDGIICFYVQDVLVRPDFQGNGLGYALMTRVIAYIDACMVKNAVVGLMAAKGKEGFYEKFGFVCRPNDNKGCGMIRP